ncbi:MAG: efflux RND transporter periplasmic adaptor subunit [Nitrospiraceae bacterium]|nr:efflux RND transporter periplasmic adaptor subunit [Nitrospirota bacterium]MDA8339773.1 efflux RND transporter periplasmic adaptor subunit [Nitrospiraceae bacterium]
MKKVLIIVIAFILIISGFFVYKKFFVKPSIKVIETAKVEKNSIRGVLVETGIIKPQVGAVVKIGARATGAIFRMNVKIGDRVKKGQLISLIDDRETRHAIEQQKAALIEAQANYDYAKVNYERERELLKHEYTTKDAVDKAKSQFEASKAKIDDIKAQLMQQETKLTYTRIYAPIDGVVSDVTAQEGETIVAGLQVANLVTVLDPTRLEMWIYVDETDIGRVRLGQKIEYYVDTYPNKLFNGTIEKIYPQPVVKDNIVYYLTIVKVTKEDALLLKPEMTTHVKIIFDEKRDILTAPNAAIKFEKGKHIAYKVTGPDKVQKVELKIGIRGEEKTEIISGVKEGDELATKLILPISTKERVKS